MIDLGSLSTVEQAINHARYQPVAELGCLQQHCTTLGGALPLIEFHPDRLGENLWEQLTLCRGRIVRAKAS